MWLQKACDEREGPVIWLKVDLTLDNLRTDPRFTQILKDMGLPRRELAAAIRCLAAEFFQHSRCLGRSGWQTKASFQLT